MTGALANHLWQSTLFAAGVAPLTVTCRRNRAAVRYWLWLAASVKFLLPFSLLMSIGAHWHWTTAATYTTARIVMPVVPVSVAQVAEPFAVAGPPVAAPFNWTALAIAVWACGVLVIAFLRLRGWLSIRTAMRASRPIDLPLPIPARVSPGLIEPGIAGFLRPVLLLPEGILERLTPPQLETVFAHELCHARRRDNLTSAVHMIVELAFWFHPLVWWIGARLIEERERACDEHVLSLGGEPRLYADGILNVCRLYAESPLACVPGVTGSNLKIRIEAIMKNRTALRLNRVKKILLASAAAVALALPVLIGIGRAPILHAQPAPIAAAVEPAPPPATPASPAPQAAPSPQPQRRLIAMLFDIGSLTPGEQEHVRQNALHIARNPSQPNTQFAIFAVGNSSAFRIIHDFTGDTAELESAIAAIKPGAPNTFNDRLANLEAVVRMLSAIPERKSIIYYSTAIRQLDTPERAQIQSVIAAAQKAQVAFFPVNPANLEPLVPNATYRGRPELPAALVDALNRERPNAPGQPAAAATAGMPGQDADVETFDRHDAFAPAHLVTTLNIPLQGFTGQVDILAEIVAQGAAASSDTPMANVRDHVQASGQTFRPAFMLNPGQYVCRLIVREQATNRIFGETIEFEVK